MLAWTAAITLSLAVALFLGAGLLRRRSGLPPGLIVWDDAHEQRGRIPRPLYDPDSGLTGRPDYLVRRGRDWVPVELKSRSAPRTPYRGHILQAGAYCLLVEAALGRRPSMALLQYSDRSVPIPYTRELEAAVRLAADRIHSHPSILPDRSHNSPARCRACGFRSECDQALA